MDKQQTAERQQKILALIQAFCEMELDKEYFELAERMLKKLGRKRNVPFLTGHPVIWAAAIIHALGTINFLFDKSAEPYVSIDDINTFFGISKSTTGNKSKQIRDLLKLKHWDNEFATKKMQRDNPFANLVMVDGLIVPLAALPEEHQEIVRQQRAQGRDVSFKTK